MKRRESTKRQWMNIIPFAITAFLASQALAYAQTIETDELPPTLETTAQEMTTQETQSSEETIELTQETQSEPESSQETQDTSENEPLIPLQIVPEFSDVGVGDTYYRAVNYLREKGIIRGYEDGSFKPDQEVNRAEALKLIAEAIKAQDTKNPETMNFPDVKTNDWFYSYVQTAWDNYLVKGYADGLFHPEQTINRAESLKMVLLQEAKSIPTSVDKPPYGDVSVNDWFAPYAAVSKERTLFLESRDGGALNPGKNMSRSEFAELIYRVLKSSEGSKFGRTTWYGVGVGTASGERFDANKMATAHKTLPFGTKLLVTNEANGKSVTVTVNDRGPYATGMELDLTSSAFESIASLGAGIVVVEFKVITEDHAAEQIEAPVQYGF